MVKQERNAANTVGANRFGCSIRIPECDMHRLMAAGDDAEDIGNPIGLFAEVENRVKFGVEWLIEA